MTDLEIWLLGTPAELDTAARALAECGPVQYHSDRIPLFGCDAGRYRLYARIHIPAAAPAPTATTAPPAQETLA